MVSESTSPTHESPSHGLAGLVERIGVVRGSPIKCYGSMGLLVRNERSRPQRIMRADQTVYLYPSRVDVLGSSAMVGGEHPYPDVVLEADYTSAEHLAQAQLRFTRKAPAPLHSTGSVGAELLRRAVEPDPDR